MIINALDIINSIVQAGVIIYTINYCFKDEYKRNNKHLILYTIITSLFFIILYKIIGNSSVNILMTHARLNEKKQINIIKLVIRS